ncbi:hypothetical protein HZA86_04500 [Candidatus Uhrbacteria bacterium]|nr:hypothetical protein [Candidatus Uhrbacteria bacterium]
MVQFPFTKIKEHRDQLQRELEERTSTYVIAALSVVAGLAWNDAVKALIEFLFPLPANNLQAKFVYAILVTMIVTIATMLMMRWVQRRRK